MNQPESLIRIGDVFTVAIGGTPSRKRPEFWDFKKEGRNIWLSIRDISQNKGLRIADSSEYISDEGVKSSNVKAIPENTALMTFKLTIGKTAVSDTDLYTNEAIAAFLPKPGTEADPYYLATILPTLNYETDQAIKGTTLNKTKIEDTLIPLPEISVQKRIAQILNSVDDTISSTQSALDKSENLNKSLMQQLFTRGIGHTKFKQTEIGEVPESWDIKRLESIAKVERGKFSHRPRNDKDYYGGNIPFIQTGDVVNSNGQIRTYNQTLNQKGLSVSRMFPIGTIVLTIAANIGSTAILEIDSCFPDSLVGITPNDGINNLYLEYFLRTKADYLNSIATQSAQKNINLEKLNPLLVAVPPIDEQKKIAQILQSIDGQIEINKKLRTKQEQLKRGLMQDLLTGKVAI